MSNEYKATGNELVDSRVKRRIMCQIMIRQIVQSLKILVLL